uniref:Uncharacterized protein n=2 Tax=unclassified bacterial viruses TaxID=12333 RepID=A0AAU6VYS9_9VIRU
MSSYKVVSKVGYHMFALGEVVKLHSEARILDTFLYVNDKGIIQRLRDDQVELVLDTNTKED